MADETPKPDRRAYGFIHAGDLPGDWGAFTKEADRARAAFETAHNAQIVPQTKTSGGRSDGQLPRRFQHRADLPDPRPSFAVPARRARDEDWFQTLPTRPDGRVLSREEFQNLRTRQASQRARRRVRGQG